MPRIMGLDYGEKRIGIAVSDELGMTAQGLETLEHANAEKDLAAIRERVERLGVAHLVVGLPLNMNGTEGPKAAAARAFAERLKTALGLPCTLWDERLTTREAERVLIQGDVSRKRRRQVIDQLAAQLILQGYLDSKSPSQDE